MASLAVATAALAPPPAGLEPFATAEDLPERSFFPRDYVAHYKRQINELVARMEHLLEEVETLEVEAEPPLEVGGVRLAPLSRETAWHNLSALLDCDTILRDTTALFTHKIRVRWAGGCT